jgi:P4 family phage/plasmid primase-like protien
VLEFYKNNGFKLFKCGVDKAPNVGKGIDWRDNRVHLDSDSVELLMNSGSYIGAWLPKDFIVLDIDMDHKDKLGNPKPNGLQPFKELCKELGIHQDLFKETLVIKTGSGGFHLYFKTDNHNLSQKGLTESVDVRTHSGYVIASGTSGYSVYSDNEVAVLPKEIEEHILANSQKRASKIAPTRKLSIEILNKILAKLDPSNFSTNDLWLEFMLSCIATAGNDDQILDTLSVWSLKDPAYTGDNTVRSRLESFQPDGGITPATFLFILKREGVSKHLLLQVRKEIGAEFKINTDLSENHEMPFYPDFALVLEKEVLFSQFYYTKNIASAVQFFVELTKEHLLYSDNENCFYYFDGNRWLTIKGIMHIVYSILLKAGETYYLDKTSKNDADADETLNEYINYIGSTTVRKNIEGELKVFPGFSKGNILWDAPDLEGTLTIADGVVDFRKDTITYRKGLKEEFRRLCIDIDTKDFKSSAEPKTFNKFIADIFPNEETRETALFALSTMVSGTGKFRKFQIWNGSGKNGKSSLMDIMGQIIGNRAITYQPSLLLQKSKYDSSSAPTPELEPFQGALVGFASETEEGKKISQGTVKQLTGNEKMTVNPKYKKMIEFHTTFQLVLATNYLPMFSAHDNAFSDRLLTIPFHTAFYSNEDEKEKYRKLGCKYLLPSENIDKLKTNILKERSGIIKNMVKRYQTIKEDIIPESPECKHLKSKYIESNDDMGAFFNDFVDYDVESGYFTPTKDIVNFYNDENNTKYSARFLALRIKEAFPEVTNGIKQIGGKNTRGFKTIRIKPGSYDEAYRGNYTTAELNFIIKASAEASGF